MFKRSTYKWCIVLVIFLSMLMIFIEAPPARAYKTRNVSFTIKTSPYWYTNVRSGPGLGYKVVGKLKPGIRVRCDGYTYGSKVTDVWLGKPDYRWYKLKGKKQWVASGVVIGNAPKSTPIYKPVKKSSKKTTSKKSTTKKTSGSSTSSANSKILKYARSYKKGTYVGSCKIFVQKVCWRAGIPLGTKYRKCYLKVGKEIKNYKNVKPGDIIQIAHKNTGKAETYYYGYHTAIVTKNYGNGKFDVIHSNWECKNAVSYKKAWSPFSWAKKYNLKVYFYRLNK